MKRKFTLLFAGFLFFILPVIGQTTYMHAYTSLNGSRAAITLNLPGGFLLTGGKTNSFTASDQDMLLVKTDTLGNIAWVKTIGTSDDDEILSMVYDGISDIAVLARSNVSGVYQYTFMMMDLTGNVSIQRTFSLNTGLNFAKMTMLATGNFLVYGTSGNKIVLLSLTPVTADNWMKDISIDAPSTSLSSIDATQMVNGNIALLVNYALGGPLTNSVFYLVFVDGTGTLVNSIAYSSTVDVSTNKIYCSPSNGNLYVVGTANSSRILLVKLTDSGSVTWSKSYDPAFLSFAYAGDAIFDPVTDRFSVLGYTIGPGFEVSTYDNDGNFLWNNGGPTYTESPVAITRSDDGNLFVTGTLPSLTTGMNDVFVCRILANGRTCSQSANVIPLTSNYTVSGAPEAFTDNGSPTLTDITLTFTSLTHSLSNDVACTYAVGVDEFVSNNKINIVSTLVNEKLSFSYYGITASGAQVSVRDLSGRIIVKKMYDASEEIQQLDVSDLSSGLYLLTISGDENSVSQKFVVQK